MRSICSEATEQRLEAHAVEKIYFLYYSFVRISSIYLVEKKSKTEENLNGVKNRGEKCRKSSLAIVATNYTVARNTRERMELQRLEIIMKISP